MKILPYSLILAFVCLTKPLSAQSALFESDEILQLRLSGDMRSLLNDRGKDAVYHKVQISYLTADSQSISVPLKVKTRGNFRRDPANCYYPPLLLNFSEKKTPPNTLFSGQDKLKLVTPCRDQKYVVHEYLVYKLYNLFTPYSFRARLVQVVFADEGKGKDSNPLYGIILEDEDQMAGRNNGVIVKRNGIRPSKTQRDLFLTMAVFEYLIGNTDWSVEYRHNIKLVLRDSALVAATVPYDFDHAGIVRAPYAHPAPALQMSSVQERRYRGFCVDDLKEFDKIFARFNELRKDIYKIYTDCPLLDPRYIRNTTKFLDVFYKTINNPKLAKRAFGYPCLQNSTVNVVIKGLRED